MSAPDPIKVREAMHAAALANVAYWDAMEVLAHALVPEGDLGDRANDKIVDLIDTLSVSVGQDIEDIPMESVQRAIHLAEI